MQTEHPVDDRKDYFNHMFGTEGVLHFRIFHGKLRIQLLKSN